VTTAPATDPVGATAFASDPVAMEALRGLARQLHIDTEYYDTEGVLHGATAAGLLAAVRAMGVALDGPDGTDAAAQQIAAIFDDPFPGPIVVWGDDALRGEIRMPSRRPVRAQLTMRLEDGGTRQWDLQADQLVRADQVGEHGREAGAPGDTLRFSFELEGPFPVGHHELVAHLDADEFHALVLVAPRRSVTLGPEERLWGIFAPTYAIAGGSGLGAHLGNLARLGEAIDSQGGKVVGTLPLLAAWLGDPYDPSPYAPVSRAFWNELYIDLEALPELASVAGAMANLEGLRSIGHAANVRGRSFDYQHQYGYVRGVLEDVVAARATWDPALLDAFEAHVAAHPDIAAYARFRAFAEQQRSGWHSWPEPQRSGTIAEADVDAEVVVFHEFVQYAMQRDLERLHDDFAARGQRLYLDLPVGAHGDGYDTWKHRTLFAWGTAAGAPPDEFFTGGQSWGFPPIIPHVSSRDGHAYFREVLRHHLRVAGILRLDHVMGLHRMFWVPDGLDAQDGVYVRYPREELFAVLSIESHRAGCVIVGEDLGTVPDEIREAMARHALLGMSVVEFSQPAWDGAPLVGPTNQQLVSVDTHDTPTFAAWLRGLDIELRLASGLLDAEEAARAHDERAHQVRNLVENLQADGTLAARADREDPIVVLAALLDHLAASDAPVLLITLDDLAGETNPQNIPGTGVDRPNWVQRLPFAATDLAHDERLGVILSDVQARRLGSYARHQERS
jgi:4-alpha-glucanotransferase